MVPRELRPQLPSLTRHDRHLPRREAERQPTNGSLLQFRKWNLKRRLPRVAGGGVTYFEHELAPMVFVTVFSIGADIGRTGSTGPTRITTTWSGRGAAGT